MQLSPELQALSALVDRLKSVGWKERDAVKEELQAALEALPSLGPATEFLEERKKSLPLEIRWEIEEVLEALAPPAPPEPEDDEEEAEDDPNRPLSMADLNLVYDDPRGLMVYKAKKGDRWFAVQPDPATGQPRMFELHPQEVTQLKAQLKGSPYWVLGAGGVGS